MKPLYHGCARVAHCATARWRNISHYCCPPTQYDVWVLCSQHREALAGAPPAHNVHKQEFTVQRGKYLVRQWTSREASLRHSSGWGTEAFPLSSVICAPVLYIIGPWVARMPADHAWRTITRADEMDEKWWNENCGRGKLEKPSEKPTQTPFRPPRNPHGGTETRTRDPSQRWEASA